MLNDNRSVTGIWNPNMKYIREEWFAQIREAGIAYFAWVSNENFIHRVILEQVVTTLQGAPAIQVFDSFEEAQTWLKRVDGRYTGSPLP